jgi:hypothetical protein
MKEKDFKVNLHEFEDKFEHISNVIVRNDRREMSQTIFEFCSDELEDDDIKLIAAESKKELRKRLKKLIEYYFNELILNN